MIKLAASSGTIIYEDQNKLYIVKMPAQWTATFLFVTGLLALILLANGMLQIFFLTMQSTIPKSLGISLIAIGILFVIIFWRVFSYRKRLNAKPVHELEHICIIDLGGHKLLDGKQNLLSPLEQVYLSRKMQITSSSPKLVLQWNKNTLTLVQGNPFSGGIGAIEKVLIAKGLKKN